MEHYAGIDVSLELSSVCVVDTRGKIVKEAKVASDPEALVDFFGSLDLAVKRIGLEAGLLSQWLYAGLKRAGFETVLLETRLSRSPPWSPSRAREPRSATRPSPTAPPELRGRLRQQPDR